MRVANCVQASCAVVIYAALVFEPAAHPPGPRRGLRRASPGLRLRGHCRPLRVRHLRDRLRRTTGTTRGATCGAPATTAATVLRSLSCQHAPEQRLDRGADFLLDQVTDHRHEAALSRHPTLPLRARDTRKMAERQRLCDSRACRSGNVTANRVALLAGIHAGEDRIPASATIAEDRVHRVAVAVVVGPTQRAGGRVECR